MPYCPKCLSEYEEGHIMCADCIIPLMEGEPPGPEKKVQETTAIHAMQQVLLCTADNHVQSRMLQEMLEREGIVVYAQTPGIGSYMRILTGDPRADENLFVDAADFEQAKELLDSIVSDEDAPPKEKFESKDAQTQRSKKPVLYRIVALLAVIGLGAGLIYLLVQWILIGSGSIIP